MNKPPTHRRSDKGLLDDSPLRRRPRHRGPVFSFDLGSLRHSASGERNYIGHGHLPDLVVSGSYVPDDEPIEFKARLSAVHEGVFVTGTVVTTWRGICRRCLEQATGALVVGVRELCVEGGDEETTYPLGRETLDLDPLVHDACILNLPLAPLCREDCLGICADCGTNRNTSSCACAAARDPRWAGLSALDGEQSARSAEQTN